MKIFFILSCVFIVQVFPTNEHAAGGRHVVADLFDCDCADYSPDIEQVIQNAATAAGATVLHVYVHKFSPQGMTGMVVLSESHIAFHTWPEHAYVACDVFTCGSTALPEKAIEVLIEFFKPKHAKIIEIVRGNRDS